MYDTLLKYCKHRNKDLWRFGQNAMEGFITQVIINGILFLTENYKIPLDDV